MLWENFSLDAVPRRHKLDVLHSLGYLSPIRLGIPAVVTVLDMIHYIYPSGIQRSKLLLWKWLLPLTWRRVDAIIAISESVKNEIAEQCPWARRKTTAIPLAVDRGLFHVTRHGPRSESTEAAKIVLAVASVASHKNLAILIEAFARIRSA